MDNYLSAHYAKHSVMPLGVDLSVSIFSSYLPPHNFITELFGPFDEDVRCYTSFKGRVRLCLIA